MKKLFSLILFTACSLPVNAQEKTTPVPAKKPPELVVSKKKGGSLYGLTEKDPIKVGGGASPVNLYLYLAGLRGPNGERVDFNRLGTCCFYKDTAARGSEKDGEGVLTVFEVCFKGCKLSKIVYFDQYRTGKVKTLKGYTFLSKEDEEKLRQKQLEKQKKELEKRKQEREKAKKNKPRPSTPSSGPPRTK